VLGWDVSKNAARSFRIDRMVRAEVQDRVFLPKKEHSFLEPVAHFSASI
jgi:predicted DNA-binding transcriptional regulator YafY